MKRGNFLKKMKKGFTLIELIVAIAVFTIFSVGAVSILVPVLNIYSGAIKLSDAQFVASNILGAVENELAYAQPNSEPKIGDGGASITFNGNYNNTRITSSPQGLTPGRLYMARGTQEEFQPYYDEGYYRNTAVEIAFLEPPEGTHAYTVIVTVKDREGSDIYTAEGSVTPLAFVGA